jgi:hypothetical protein
MVPGKSAKKLQITLSVDPDYALSHISLKAKESSYEVIKKQL